MNRSDLPRIATAIHAAASELDRHGQTIFTATHDWQSPLRSSQGGPQGKGGHGDPTYAAYADPDPLALEHGMLVANIEASLKAVTAMAEQLRRLKAINPDEVDRSRQNTIPTCLVCTAPDPRLRRGFCSPCYTAWLRADRPDFVTFRNLRLVAIAPPERQHVDPTKVSA